MRKLIQKIDWNKFRIRSRKDWVIFWAFAALICYAMGLRYDYKPDQWLFQFANPYMTNLNQPYTWGQLIVFLGLLAIVVEVVLFLCKKPVKARVLVLAGVLLMPMIVLAGYRIHTNLIVSSMWKEEPENVFVYWADADSGKRIDLALTEEEKQAILELCRELTPVSDEGEQEILMQWYLEDSGKHFSQDNSVSLYFAEKYGHSYSFTLRLCDGKMYLWRGYGSSMKVYVTFFENTDISGKIEEIMTSAASRTVRNAE